MHAFREVRSDNRFFLISDSIDPKKFLEALPLLDSFIDGGRIIKHSHTTTASVSDTPFSDGPVFLKRTNNKGFRFTLRYLFRKARAFRAAAAGRRLRESGIITPEVLAAGEYRTRLVLHAGYLITEYCEGSADAASLLHAATRDEAAGIVRAASSLLSKIHSAGVSHGDFKLQNVYIRGDGSAGVWDLDGARVFSGPAPKLFARRDLERLRESCLAESGILTAEEIYEITGKGNE